jgi:hypothetical protein
MKVQINTDNHIAGQRGSRLTSKRQPQAPLTASTILSPGLEYTSVTRTALRTGRTTSAA